MSAYANGTDVENYIEGWVTTDPFFLERTLQRAERDVDPILFFLNKILPPTQVISLEKVTGGNYTVSFNGQVTTSLPWNTTALGLQGALQALPAIGTDPNSGLSEVTVLGQNPFTLLWNTQWAMSHWVGVPNSPDFAIPVVTVDASGLTGNGLTVNIVQVPGRKINPLTDINENQVRFLSNAICAQVEYRSQMGENFFVRPQYASVKGPDFTTSGRLPQVGPKVRRELAQSGLMLRGGRAVAAYGRRGIGSGWPTY